SFKTLCLLNYALMKRHDYDITVFFTKRGVTIMVSEPEIREEFRTSSGPSDAGGNPPPVTIHTWLERFNKQKPCSFEKATTPVDAENWISHMEKIFDVMGCEDAFKTRLAVPQDFNASSAVPCLFIHFSYVIPCLYIRSLSVMLSRISFHVLYGRKWGCYTAQSVRSSNAYALDSPYLLALNTETSQSRQHNMSESDSYYLSD
nr:zinc finger, CCHC-type, retrotransposon Gag domain protein [Tanacetum cinerariifolium]